MALFYNELIIYEGVGVTDGRFTLSVLHTVLLGL